MTDKPQPLHILIEGFDPEAVRRALAPLAEMTARMRFRNTARAALTSCLSHDDDNAAIALEGLDPDQLKRIVDAASGLAIHASRHRKTLTEDDQPERGPSVAGAYVDEWTGPDEQDAALAEELDRETKAATEALAAEELSTWTLHTVRASELEKQIRKRLDDAERAACTRNTTVDPEGIQDADPARVMSRADLAAELRAAERRVEHFEEHAAQINADLGIETQRADTAERERDTAREALAAAGVVVASLRDQRDEQRHRAETAERRYTEQHARAEQQKQRAEKAELDATRAEAEAARVTGQRDAARDDAETAVRQLNQAEKTLDRAREILHRPGASWPSRAEAAELRRILAD